VVGLYFVLPIAQAALLFVVKEEADKKDPEGTDEPFGAQHKHQTILSVVLALGFGWSGILLFLPWGYMLLLAEQANLTASNSFGN